MTFDFSVNLTPSETKEIQTIMKNENLKTNVDVFCYFYDFYKKQNITKRELLKLDKDLAKHVRLLKKNNKIPSLQEQLKKLKGKYPQ